MKSKPVRKYSRPRYPTRLEIAARPTLLHRHQPPAWRKWPELTSAAGLFLLADAARLQAADTFGGGGQTQLENKAVAIIAPIFQHGEGRGAIGCIVMAPPVFLSEEESLQVIREEMAARGVILTTNETKVAGVTISNWKPEVGSTQDPFKARAADPKKKVFVEFVSERNAWRWDLEKGKEEGNYQLSTVRSFNMPKTAAYVAERVKRQATDKIYFGTFYDPLAGKWDFTGDGPRSEQIASTGRVADLKSKNGKLTAKWPSQAEGPRSESRRLLRLQVQDFLKWLQAQGAI